MLVTEPDSSIMHAFHQPHNPASAVAASCYYKHKLMGDLKDHRKRSDFDSETRNLWPDKYYGAPSPALQVHANHFTGINQTKHYPDLPLRETSGVIPYTPNQHNPNYNQCHSKAQYYPQHNTVTGSTSQTAGSAMFQWQQNLHQQQQANQLQHRLSHQQPHISHVAPNQEEVIPNSASSKFTNMFLRGQHPAGYLLSLNENSTPWCQPTDPSKDSIFQPPATKNVCPLCGKNYARPSTLKTHMRIHSGERPFHCKVCNKSFSQAANLTAHLRVHSGEKPFSCPVCNKQFSQSSSVTTHMRTHSGDRPYKCPVCRKGFSDSSTLTKHLRIHSGEKPYHCNFCYMSFSQSGNLNRHMKVHEHNHRPESTTSSSPARMSPNEQLQ